LRQAVSDANLSPGADTIMFSFVTGTIGLTNGELAISDAVTINGPGPSVLAVSAGTNGRVFNTQGAPAQAPIMISGLPLEDGRSPSGAGVYSGDEALTLTNCAIAGNVASGPGAGQGGGIFSGGTLTLTDCDVLNNSAGGGGGGIYAETLTMQNCIISGNHSA